MTPTQHIGSRIRLYRTQRHLSLTELSKMISRSPSTLSKYESGKITIDIDTLFEIAEALNVSVNQLTDYVKPNSTKPAKNNNNNFFQQEDLYFMYSFFGVDKRFYVCALEIIRNPNSEKDGDKVILYYDIENTKNYTNSNFLYTGYITYSDFYVTMTLDNPYNPVDKLFIYTKTPFHTNGVSTGLLLGISSSMRTPCSFKVLFSKSALDESSDLKKTLNLSHKDTISEMRRTNCLMLY